MKITKSRLKQIIKEEVQKFRLEEDSYSPPSSWYEPDHGEEDTREYADTSGVVEYFISDVLGKVDVSEFANKIAERISADNQSWDASDTAELLNNPKLQAALSNDLDVQGELEAGGTLEDLFSSEEINRHLELEAERSAKWAEEGAHGNY